MNKNFFNFPLIIAALILMLVLNYTNFALAQDDSSSATKTSSVPGILGNCVSESLEFKVPKHFGEAYNGIEKFTYETITAEELMSFSKGALAVYGDNVKRSDYEKFLAPYGLTEDRFMELRGRLMFLYDSALNKIPYSEVAETLGVDDSEIAYCDYDLIKNNMTLVEKAIANSAGRAS